MAHGEDELGYSRHSCDLGPSADDTFANDLFGNKKFDYILANPPFNLEDWGQPALQDDIRWQYGIPPATNANFAWIQHMIHHLAPNGRIGLVLANGALKSMTGGEDEIRKNIVDADLVEGIVALPGQLFYSTPIPVSLWFITKTKRTPGKTLFVDARGLGHMEDRTHKDFSPEDIAKIAATFESFRAGDFVPEAGFSAEATQEEISDHKYILTPGIYVGLPEEEDEEEPFGQRMSRLTSEVSSMFSENSRLEQSIREQLSAIGFPVA